MADQPFRQYLVGSDGEHWFPFFHLIYYELAVKTCYQLLDHKDPRKILSSEDSKELFCPQSHPFLTEKQALAIKRFLHDLPAKP